MKMGVEGVLENHEQEKPTNGFSWVSVIGKPPGPWGKWFSVARQIRKWAFQFGGKRYFVERDFNIWESCGRQKERPKLPYQVEKDGGAQFNAWLSPRAFRPKSKWNQDEAAQFRD